MTASERIAHCSECTKKKFDPQEGIVCSLDGKKPQFDDTCPNFDGDINKVTARINQAAHTTSSGEIGGFLAWYLVFVGLGSVASLIINLATLNLSGDYAGSWILACADIISWLFYAGLGIYVIIAFVKRLPNAVTLAKIQLVTLVVINSIVLLSGDLDSSSTLSTPTRLISSLIWSVIFFIYLSSSERVKDLIPKETRHLYKADKIFIFGTIGLIFILFIYGVVDIAGINPLASKRSRLDKQIAAAKAELPIEVNEYITFTDIAVEGDNLVLTYKYPTISASNIDYPRKKEIGLMDKERRLAGLYIDKDEPFEEYVSDGYALVSRFIDSSDDFFYEFRLSSEEFMEAYESTGTYSTKEDVLDEIIALFNSGLPDEYIGGTLLNTVERDLIGRGLIFNMTIPDVTVDALSYLTKTYFHDYLEENFSVLTDDMMEIAFMNDFDVTFRFSADCSSWWSSSVTFTPAEYKKLIEF